MSPPSPSTSPSDTAYVGRPIDRLDGRAKVTGAARYAAEYFPPKVAQAWAFLSTIANGRVTSIDTTAAQKLPGVVAILTHENLPKIKAPDMDDKQGKPGQTFLPMQSDRVNYAGQPLGFAIAETIEQAQEAAGAVKVTYAQEKPEIWVEERAAEAYKPKKMGREDKPDSERGDPDAAFSAAPVKVEQTYVIPQENQNPMEMSATVAAWDGDRLTLYNTTQWIYGCRHAVAVAMGVPEENVRVVCPYVGGAFGCKGSTWPHEYLTALAARVIQRPVRLVLSRPMMFTGCGARPHLVQNIRLGAGADGKLAAITHDVINHTSMTDPWTEPAAQQTRMLYSCPNVRTTHRLVKINSVTPCQMRAPGHAPGTFALEVAMDELAYALKMDPVQLRLVNYAEQDEDEKKPFSSKALRECYQQAGDKFGWSKRNPEPGSMKDGQTLVGYGMATAVYPTNRQKATVTVRMEQDGRARVTCATHDLGTGTYTIMTQIAAETLGLPLEKVRFELGDSKFPDSPVAGGSQTAASVGSAVKAACLKARDQMKRTARPFEVTQESGPAKDDPFSPHAWGAQFAEVRIDPLLREIRVARVVAAFAGGRILNEKTAHSQVMGAIVMGVGAALMEHTVYDPVRGKIVNDNLSDYLVPVNPDVPSIDCWFVQEDDPHVNELGAKGLGELGNTGISAAIANAVYHATGRRIREFPITLEKIM